jgi:hypothetical protein
MMSQEIQTSLQNNVNSTLFPAYNPNTLLFWHHIRQCCLIRVQLWSTICLHISEAFMNKLRYMQHFLQWSMYKSNKQQITLYKSWITQLTYKQRAKLYTITIHCDIFTLHLSVNHNTHSIHLLPVTCIICAHSLRPKLTEKQQLPFK